VFLLRITRRIKKCPRRRKAVEKKFSRRWAATAALTTSQKTITILTRMNIPTGLALLFVLLEGLA
jgi:hypothetical protein